ncbi:MAG: glycogen synthase GlgA [Actinobacteria bacterium]|nr:glycogen synthase GlgA [Actinomycetota bacterium]
MRILFVTTEAVPFAKFGGLGDVSGTLPVELAKLGLDVSVVLPLYRHARANAERLEPTDLTISIPLGETPSAARVWRSNMPNSDVPIYFLEQNDLYDREEMYGLKGEEYEDNYRRFYFLNRGALELARALGIGFDVVHVNDWMTGLIPIYLKTIFKEDPYFKETVSVFTIHNLGNLGLISRKNFELMGLSGRPEVEEMALDGEICQLKGALIYSDVLNTVSRQYAKEVQTAEFGEGFEELLRSRSDDLFGILNGIDCSIWNPETDRLIPFNYAAENLSGKAACKAALQRENGLPERGDVPLLGIVCRLSEQKGLDMLVEVFEDFLALDVQLVLLGTGVPEYEDFLRDAAERYPTKLAANIKFDEPLSHRIEAGADIFLMPSRFEPCGLTQMISLKYGTVPVVRRTGGLADTITDYATTNLEEANGFSFNSMQGRDLLACTKRAISLYQDRAEWKRLMLNGMKQEWSWRKSAREYVKLYEHALSRKFAVMGPSNG